MRLKGLMATALAVCGLGVLAPGALASGAPQGPPAGPTSPPFYQCPAIGQDTSCQYLIDVTSTNPKVPPTIVEDASQGYYDGSDDVTVGVQNDTVAPLSSIHVGVAGSGDGVFGFDGDGLCNPGDGPAPAGCPFGPAGENVSPYDYYGPDTVLEPDSATQDDGTVTFTTPLQPGQYTYFSLEAPPAGTSVVAGEVNDTVKTSLTDTEPSEVPPGPRIATPSPAAISDQATILGPNAVSATGKVKYKVYSDARCTKLIANAGEKNVVNGVAEPSEPVGKALPTNATYYWQVEYSGNLAPNENTPAVSVCGDEVMTFGAPTITTVLSGGGQVGTQLTVPAGTAVTDTATVTAPGGQPITGQLTYEVYTSSNCAPSSLFTSAGGGHTTGSGPASNALTLPAGSYWFQAVYSGSGVLGPAVSPCGSEVLTVASPPPPPPNSLFISVGDPQVNTHNGQLVVIGQFPEAGTATVTAVVQHGATLARVQLPLAAAVLNAETARHHRCARGFVRRGHRCINDAPGLYGSTAQAIPGPGTYSIVINPTSRALRALKLGRALGVTISITFQNRAGGTPVTHVQAVRVKLKHHHHRR